MNIKGKLSNSYFSNMLIYLSLIVVTVTIIVSTILYFYFEQTLLKKTYSSSMDSISQISYTADSMLENVKVAIGQIISDPKLKLMLYETNEMDTDEIIAISERLSLFGSVPFLQSIYLYNGKLDQIITSTGGSTNRNNFADQGIIDILDGFNPEYNILPIPRKVELSGRNADFHVYTFIYYETSGPIEGSAVILNVSDSWLRNAINLLDKRQNGSVMILDSNGTIINSTYKDSMLTDVSEQEYVKKVIDSKDETGYFVGNVDGQRSVVTYASSPQLGWKYIRYIPYQTISQELNHMRFITAEICVAILLVGLLLSYLVSKRLHLPILHLLKQVDSQKQQIMDNSYKIKQDFMRELLFFDQDIAVRSVVNRFGEFNIPLDPEANIRIILLKIDQYEQFMTTYSFNDRNLLRFGMMNIASEILLPHAACETIDLQDHIVIILNADDANPKSTDLQKWTKEIQRHIQHYLRLSISAAIGSSDSLTSVNKLHEEALEISQYRLFYGWGSLIFHEEIALRLNLPLAYSADKEELLVDSLMLGKIKEAKEACMSILDVTFENSYRAFEITMMRMFFSIHMAVDTMEKASGYPFHIYFNEELHKLTKQERMEDITEAFLKLLERIEFKLGEKRSTKYDNLMQKIDTIIKNNYMKEALSLEWIADSLSMSPMYLGRLIKKYMSKSVTDYITEIRMERAAELLVTTDLLITEVSQRCGFSGNSYFGKLFKKRFGVTPNEYRQKKLDDT